MGELRAMIDQGLAMAWRRRWLAAAVFLVVFAAGMTAARSLPVLYRSTTLVAIEEQQVPEQFVKNTVTGQLEARLLQMSQELLSRARLEELVERFSLYPELRDRATTAALTGQLRSDIDLEVRGVQSKVRGTPVTALSISYRGNDPKTVAAIVNALASGYVEENTRVRERQALGTADFLKSHLREAAERLDQQEQKVSAFKRRYLGELPEQSQANLATLERLHDQLRNTRDSQIRAQRAHRAARPDQLAGDRPAEPSREPRQRRLERPCARASSRLKQELIELRLRFSDKYPDVAPETGGDRRARATLGIGRRADHGRGSVPAERDRCRNARHVTGRPAGGRGAQAPEGGGEAAAGRDRRVPGAHREHPEARAGVPGAVARLRVHERACTRRCSSGMRKRRSPAISSTGRRASSSGFSRPRSPASSGSPRRWRVTALAFVGALALAAVAVFLAG